MAILLRSVLLWGIAGSVVLSGLVLGTLWYNPRLMLQDYPPDVRRVAPPKTASERRLSGTLGGVFVLLLVALPVVSTITLKSSDHSLSFGDAFLNAFGALLIFNLVDLLIIDLLLVCSITPTFIVIPGTEGMPGYKNYWMHVRGFLIGVTVAALVSLIISAAVTWL